MSPQEKTPRAGRERPADPRSVVAADVGGTRVRFAAATVVAGRCELGATRTIPSREQHGLERPFAEFLATLDGPVAAACLAVAGPVIDGHARLPNLPWDVTESAMREASGLDRLRVVNDFDAAAHGLSLLAEEDRVVLQQGRARPGATVALIGAGTGLGMAFLTTAGEATGGTVVHSSEGGHAPFAPADEEEDALVRFLRSRHGHVSWERVVSGPGLVGLHDFLVETGRFEQSAELSRAMEEIDPAAAITRAARAGDPGCLRAIEMFLVAYGRVAGSFALTVQAEGGVWIGGGIAPRLIDEIQAGPFVAAFRAQGRMSHLVERMPLRVVLAPHLGLIGAAAVAASLCEASAAS